MDNMNDKKVMSQEYDIQNIIENDNNLDVYEKKLFKEVLLNLKEEQMTCLLNTMEIRNIKKSMKKDLQNIKKMKQKQQMEQ